VPATSAELRQLAADADRAADAARDAAANAARDVTDTGLRVAFGAVANALSIADTVRDAAHDVRAAHEVSAAVLATGDDAACAARLAPLAAAAVSASVDALLAPHRADSVLFDVVLDAHAGTAPVLEADRAERSARTAAVLALRVADLVDAIAAAGQVAAAPASLRAGNSAASVWERRAVRLRVSAVAALHGLPEAGRWAEEWEYDMAQLPEGWAQFRWALSLRLHAPRTIRRAAVAKKRVPAPSAPPSGG